MIYVSYYCGYWLRLFTFVCMYCCRMDVEVAWREGFTHLATPSVEGLGLGTPPPSKVVTIHQTRLIVQRSLNKLPAAIARGVAAGHCTNPRHCQAGTCEQCACADE